MIEARPWLPDSCLTSRRAAAAFADVVAGWSAHWFAKPRLKAADRWVRREGTMSAGTADPGPAKSILPGLALQYRHEADLAAGEALLTLPASRTPLHAQDRQLLRAAGGAILSDLEDRLARLVNRSTGEGGASFAENDHNLFELRIDDPAGLAVLRFLASSELLVKIVKDEIQPQRPLPPLAARAEAVSANEVECATRIGLARLPYSDLLDLSVGDVLVLDASHEDPFDLTVEGQVAFPRAVTPTPGGAIHS